MAGQGRPPRSDTHRRIDAHVGARIRRRREELGWSQLALAAALEVTQQQAQGWESGAAISAARLAEIAALLQVPAGYFFAGFSDDAPPPSAAPARPVAPELLGCAETLALVGDFYTLSPRHRAAVAALARTLARSTAPVALGGGATTTETE